MGVLGLLQFYFSTGADSGRRPLIHLLVNSLHHRFISRPNRVLTYKLTNLRSRFPHALNHLAVLCLIVSIIWIALRLELIIMEIKSLRKLCIFFVPTFPLGHVVPQILHFENWSQSI